MFKEEYGNLVTGNYPIICQQVNCKGVMGSGLAKAIREKYPEVYTGYKNFISAAKMFNDTLLGSINLVHLHDNRHCVNMFAQDSYGRDGKQYTDYNAFSNCLRELEMVLPQKKGIVAFPYLIGCGLGGGDWGIVKEMIRDFSEKIEQDVVIVRI